MLGCVVGLFIEVMTFPGVPVHEFAHVWACRRAGVRVHEVCYLRIGNPRGYVVHEQPQTPWQQVFICVAPFFVCTLIAMIIGLAAGLLFDTKILSKPHEEVVGPCILWLGFAVGACAFPSGGDADSLWEAANSPDIGLFSKVLIMPVVGLIRLAQVGSFFWLDVIWGIVSAVNLPAALLQLLISR